MHSSSSFYFVFAAKALKIVICMNEYFWAHDELMKSLNKMQLSNKPSDIL